MSTDTLATAKAAMRVQVGLDIAEKLRAIREESPQLDYQQSWDLLAKREPSLFAYAAKVEADQWPHEPVYRYTGGEDFARERSFKVQAKKPKDDDRELVLVMANNEIVDLELVQADHKEEQARQEAILEILKANPGLTRDFAIQLAKDRDPELFEDSTQRDQVEQNQALIKDEIARLQERDKTLTFAKAWGKVQGTHPQWFKEFEAP